MTKSYPENNEKRVTMLLAFQVEDFEHYNCNISIRTILFWPIPLSGCMSLRQKSTFKRNVLSYYA